MAVRCFVFIAVIASIFIVSCEANEASSYSEARASSDGSTATSFASSRSKARSPKRRKCFKMKRCTENEEYSYCTQSIGRAQYCSQYGQTIRSQDDTPTACKEGCVCKEDYLRDINGTCIADRDCTTNCAPTEVLDDCPADCTSDFCPTNNDDVPPCERPDQGQCPAPVCKCRFNYRRAVNGSCIPTKLCPPFDCSSLPNEEYDPCPPYCPTDDCSQASPSGECPINFGHILITLECSPKCRCIKGYWRNDGICVPYQDCPGVSPPNEEYSVCTQATCRAQYCSQRRKPIACPMIMQGSCTPGYVCKQGFLRLENGTCVAEDQCGPPTCGDNEVLDECPVDCPSDYCPKSEEDNIQCPRPDVCPPPTCKCAFNYRLDDNGNCIPTEECPPFDCNDKPNEEYAPCPPICPSDECSLPRVTGRCPFYIGIRLECNPKCQCKDDYGRSNGVCVPFEECPSLCATNEEYSSCVQALCRNQNCHERARPVPCVDMDRKACIKGCVCKEDYYRNEDGNCVSDTECAPACPNPHEVYTVSRKPNCPALDTCRSIVSRFVCDKPEVGGCTCEDGYLRLNETSPCIPICKCPEMANAEQCQ